MMGFNVQSAHLLNFVSTLTVDYTIVEYTTLSTNYTKKINVLRLSQIKDDIDVVNITVFIRFLLSYSRVNYLLI